MNDVSNAAGGGNIPTKGVGIDSTDDENSSRLVNSNDFESVTDSPNEIRLAL